MRYGQAKFILERKHEFSSEFQERKAVVCGLTPEYGGGLFIEGVQKDLHAGALKSVGLLITLM